jgi:hypothetical protein
MEWARGSKNYEEFGRYNNKDAVKSERMVWEWRNKLWKKLLENIKLSSKVQIKLPSLLKEYDYGSWIVNC